MILSFRKASGFQTKPYVLPSSLSTHCVPFLPPPAPFVIALFTWTAPQRSRCTCPLSNIWHLGTSLGGWLCNSSNALLKLAQYSGSEACRRTSQVQLFRASVWFKRSSCHKQFLSIIVLLNGKKTHIIKFRCFSSLSFSCVRYAFCCIHTKFEAFQYYLWIICI